MEPKASSLRASLGLKKQGNSLVQKVRHNAKT